MTDWLEHSEKWADSFLKAAHAEPSELVDDALMFRLEKFMLCAQEALVEALRDLGHRVPVDTLSLAESEGLIGGELAHTWRQLASAVDAHASTGSPRDRDVAQFVRSSGPDAVGAFLEAISRGAVPSPR